MANSVAELSYLEGRAFLMNGVRPQALEIGHKLKAGDYFELDENSVATLDMGEKGSLRLMGKTRLEIPMTHPEKALSYSDLVFGKIWCSLKKLIQGDEFTVRTPTATAGVRGTDFQISFDPINKLTQTIVAKGVVDLTDLNGQIQSLTEGMMADINNMTTNLVQNQLQSVDQFLKAMKIPLNNSQEALNASNAMVQQLQQQLNQMQQQIQNQMQQFDQQMQNFQQNLNQNLDQMNQQIQNNNQQFLNNLDQNLKNLPGMNFPGMQQSGSDDDEEDSSMEMNFQWGDED